MRPSLVSLGLGLLGAVALPQFAAAADMAPPPVLRGPLPASEASMDWSGFYAGGFGGFSQMEFEPRNAASGLVRTMLTSTIWLNPGRADDVVIQKRTTANKVTFGGYVGYNMMIDDYVIGAEADYTRGGFNGTATGGRSGAFDYTSGNTPPDRYRYDTRVASKLKLTEMGTIRARFGVPFGSVMPFVTAGLALGRFSYGNDAAMDGYVRPFLGYDANNNPVYAANFSPTGTYSLRDGSRTRFAIGYALGAGLDWALTQNIVLRGELMHVRFGSAGDTTAAINTARAGAAVKF